MKYVFVLENEERFQKEIFDTLIRIDPKLSPRFFMNLDEFSTFIQGVIQSGVSALHTAGVPYKDDKNGLMVNTSEESSLLLVICNDELIGHRRIELLEKARQLFVRKKICSTEDPTSFVMTAFDKPDFRIREVEKNYISNVIFKPFDPLILEQQITTALGGRHLIKSSLVHTMKTQVHVEMIKVVDAESFSDVGFVTRGPQKVEVGQIAKYYGDLFTATQRNYIYARCWKCEPHPEIADQFRLWFTFFGSEPVSHTEFRRKLANLKAPEIKLIKENTKPLSTVVALIDSQDAKRKEMRIAIEQNLKPVRVLEFASWDDFIMQADPMSYEAAQKAEPWAGEDSIGVILDTAGHHIVAFDPPLPEGKKFLGMQVNEAMKIDFQKSVTEFSQTGWMKQFTTKKAMVGVDSILQLNLNTGKFLVKCMQINEVRSDKQILTGVRFLFKKPSLDERIYWYQQKTFLKENINCIVCPKEYLLGKQKETWDIMLPNLQKKAGGVIPVLGIVEESANESLFLSMPSWIFDITINHHDKTEFLRKLALFLGKPFDSGFKFFEANLEIRVASPIQISALSETHLTMKYHREIGIGTFRRFVLPKATGGAILEYLATCNFSEEDKNEKETFVNQFVFFGIQDLYLKNIRVWIRENYALEKEKSAG